mmetsp:Transcript_7287/g.14580  ORF Transcript_7287/g.14580 Transcript_7287/m.14580 type:complete len:192 (+) Transcript_7287:37-612(+)|eukprot:CAMPEP_0119065802 /NCGR_PEP_ID=MMETSP1178-20130426/8529_1 /TAXON_ID=33656 /ORGANISM="unid sp, Strain CCMP2000" /LENGTH=191 /DNA_ID=CAMNT_0007047355 /DNA_START=37 /DNA_END=612 /DNA_ORIENTATION=+
MPIEVIVNTHRTLHDVTTGKDVTEYSVSARGKAGPYPVTCQSWHRYTDFRELHDQIAAELGLGKFPCPKALIFTDAQRDQRAGELQAYLQACVIAWAGRYEGQPPVGESMPAALQAFLFTCPEGSKSITGGRPRHGKGRLVLVVATLFVAFALWYWQRDASAGFSLNSTDQVDGTEPDSDTGSSAAFEIRS